MFAIKYNVMRRKSDRYEIRQRSIDIANHVSPNSIGGIATCPEGHYQKVVFNTGLIIIYEFVEPDICFIAFYYDGAKIFHSREDSGP